MNNTLLLITFGIACICAGFMFGTAVISAHAWSIGTAAFVAFTASAFWTGLLLWEKLKAE